MRIFEKIVESLEQEKRLMLATIIATSGSTPVPSDSKMLLFPDEGAKAIGTVGGGCLDANIIVAVKNNAKSDEIRIMEYQLDDDTGDTGLNCGGNVTVVLEALSRTMLPLFKTIVQMHNDGEDCCVVTRVREDKTTQKFLFDAEGKLLIGEMLPSSVESLLREIMQKPDVTRETKRLLLGTDDYVVEFIQSAPRVVVFGGGHVGKAVCRCASLAGFRVTMVDDRRPFANKERFPEADAVLCESFDKAFDRLNITPSAYVVIVTRGHKHDEQVLEKTLRFNPRYIGMIGSKRKVLGIYTHLAERGIPIDMLSNIHAPIGVVIGASTAEEIGVSITAELIACRRNVLDAVGHSISMRIQYPK